MENSMLSTVTAARQSELERLSAAIYNQRETIGMLGERLALVRHMAPVNTTGAVLSKDSSNHISELVDYVERNTNALRDILDSLAI